MHRDVCIDIDPTQTSGQYESKESTHLDNIQNIFALTYQKSPLTASPKTTLKNTVRIKMVIPSGMDRQLEIDLGSWARVPDWW